MMDPVKLLRIDPIEMAHRPRQNSRRDRQQEMVVVIHQAIGIDLNLPQPGHVGEQVEKSLAFFVFDEDITAGLATVHDVIVRAGYSIRSGLAMPIFYFIVNLVSIAKSGLDPFRSATPFAPPFAPTPFRCPGGI